jgi:uncharacterized protein YebE (UPF0316 family)
MISTLPLLVFFAETCVVTLSTVRTIFVARGWKSLAPLLGFFEVSIWLFAIAQVMQNLTSPGCFIAFAGGFSLGNFLGVLIEQKLALGNVVVYITTKENAADLMGRLKKVGYGVTALEAQGATGRVQVVFTVIKRKELPNVVAIIKTFDLKAFYSVNDLKTAVEGIFPTPKRSWRGLIPMLELPSRVVEHVPVQTH